MIQQRKTKSALEATKHIEEPKVLRACQKDVINKWWRENITWGPLELMKGSCARTQWYAAQARWKMVLLGG